MSSPIMQHFKFKRLPLDTPLICEPIDGLAYYMDNTLPDCAEKSAGLRKLLEAKDCFIRAQLETQLEK